MEENRVSATGIGRLLRDVWSSSAASAADEPLGDHPDRDALAALARGTLENERRESLRRHLLACAPCRGAFATERELQLRAVGERFVEAERARGRARQEHASAGLAERSRDLLARLRTAAQESLVARLLQPSLDVSTVYASTRRDGAEVFVCPTGESFEVDDLIVRTDGAALRAWVWLDADRLPGDQTIVLEVLHKGLDGALAAIELTPQRRLDLRSSDGLLVPLGGPSREDETAESPKAPAAMRPEDDDPARWREVAAGPFWVRLTW
jgi:hypothetical protein